MRSPFSASSFSSTSSSEASGEPSTPMRASSPADSQDPLQLSPVSPLKSHPQLSLSPSSAFHHNHHNIGSSRLKRRASQGSLLTKPSPVSRFLSRSNASLHLPSLEDFGLFSKSPTRAESQSNPSDTRLRVSTSSTASGSLAARASQSTAGVWETSAAKSDYLSALPPTPPDDNDHIAWNPSSGMLLFESHMNREPGPMAMDEGPSIGNSPGRTSDGLSSPSDQLSNGSPSSSGGSPGSSGDMDCDHNSWLENSIEASISSLPFSNGRGEAVKIVSQMLPYPRPADKSVPVSAHDSVYCALVHAIQDRLRHGQSPYINITHAVPEQFSLSNLPSSPPPTPRSLFSGEDYFNPPAVFSSAAVVSAYHDFRGPIQPKTTYSPMPIVPPHTVHVSVLERYLPPSSPQEYKDMFSRYRPSFLVDRLSSAHLDRDLWTEWYIHQEKSRMKEVLSVYWQNGRRLPATKAVSNMSTNYILEDKEVTSAMLLREILDGIRRRPYGEDSEPRDGVELGVFVIRRTH
ncbi:similar to An02g09030 [Aspergillus luchuensis]|uniref:Similar to An02g09030 n=1 Tax=Aspergillus kawachii TaxID=1069201 RepID=A0A146FCR0_ASPKA|nr:similar to An02g09030 [Aspergillus luchuensis]